MIQRWGWICGCFGLPCMRHGEKLEKTKRSIRQHHVNREPLPSFAERGRYRTQGVKHEFSTLFFATFPTSLRIHLTEILSTQCSKQRAETNRKGRTRSPPERDQSQKSISRENEESRSRATKHRSTKRHHRRREEEEEEAE